jgi:hypothetical protein
MAQKKHLTGWILEAVARHSGEANVARNRSATMCAFG